MRSVATPLLLLAMLAGPACAAVMSPRPDSVSLAIYHQGTVDTAELTRSGDSLARRQGLALVTETRTLDLPAGPVEIQFRGVAATMVPATADVSGLPGVIKDRNFDFDLLSPGSLIAKSVGANVHLVRTNPKTGAQTDEPATLASGPDGVVLKFADHVEALDCSGAPERLVFDSVPAQLFDTPTLSVHAMVPRAGHYTVTLRYIATGMNWSADYVARVPDGATTLDLSGWITLANFSETGFAHAPVEVIAGHVATTGKDRPPPVPETFRQTQCWPTAINWASYYDVETALVAGTRIEGLLPPMVVAARLAPAPAPPPPGANIEARDLGDYKLYPLHEPTDVAAQETKQVQFLDARAVPFTRVYRAGMGGGRLAADYFGRVGSDAPVASTILLRLDNSKKGKLGAPLPAGGVSVLAGTAAAPFLTGQDRIDDMSVGLPVEIVAGQTMAVHATASVVDNRVRTEGRRTIARSQMEITAVNDKADAVTFEWHQAMDNAGMVLVTQSRGHGTRNGDLVWTLALKPGERATFRYTMDVPG